MKEFAILLAWAACAGAFLGALGFLLKGIVVLIANLLLLI
jgi:hypothetical protein